MSIGAVTQDWTLAVKIPTGYQLFHIRNATQARALVLANGVMADWIENNKLGFVDAIFGREAIPPSVNKPE